MALGVRVRNSSGFIQIDGNYRNAALVAKHVITPTGSANQNGMYYTSLTITAINPFLVGYTGNTNNDMSISFVSRTGNSWSFHIFTRTLAAVEIYHFDNMSIAQVANVNVGIRIRNVNTGEVVFDSRCKYMRVIDTEFGFDDLNFQPTSRAYTVAKVGVLQAARFLTSPSEVLPGPQPLIITAIQMSTFAAWSGSMRTSSGPLIVRGPESGISVFGFESHTWGHLMVDLSNLD